MIKSLAVAALLGVSQASRSHIQIRQDPYVGDPNEHKDDVHYVDGMITIETVQFEADVVVQAYWEHREDKERCLDLYSQIKQAYADLGVLAGKFEDLVTEYNNCGGGCLEPTYILCGDTCRTREDCCNQVYDGRSFCAHATNIDGVKHVFDNTAGLGGWFWCARKCCNR